MAKIVLQFSLADYGLIEENLGDLERLQLVLEGLDDEKLMLKLETKRANGRDDYPVRVMWNLFIAMKIFGHRTISSFRRELSRNSQLRKICGLNDFARKCHLVPPARVFSNFIKTLVSVQGEIDTMFSGTVSELVGALPGFGKNAAGDGKYLDSYAKSKHNDPNPNAGDRAENDAAWSTKTYHYLDQKGEEKAKKEYHYGHRAHIVCDVGTGLPMAYNVLAANSDEKKAMMDLLDNMPSTTLYRMDTLSLDRGYDSTPMIRAIKGAGILPFVDIRNCWKSGETKKRYKETDIFYDFQGNVYFADSNGEYHKMAYQGYDRQKNCLRYKYNGKTYKIKISYDERVFLPVARDSLKFARIYKGRTAVERLNGRLDRDFLFEDHCIRGLKKMRLMVSLSLLFMNAMALGKIGRGVTEHLASMTRAC
jgi:hypothetical protein